MPDKIGPNHFGPPPAGSKDGLQGGSLHIEIDGRIYSVPAGDNLLRASLSQGLELPYFCWHPCLGSVGACRQCAVVQYQNPEDRSGRIVMACMTPVTEGMRVSIEAPEARAFRAGVIELLMSNHPHDCPVCEEGGECHLQDMTEMSGHTFRTFRGRKRTHRNQNLGPFINHEMNRCIACYRCVRYYQDYCGGHDLQVFGAHNHVYFGRHADGALENEFSGNLVEVCPTGVFTDKTFSRHYTRKWDLQSAPSVCVHCGLGCNTSPGERYGSLRRIVNRYHGEINGYFLCDRGRYGYGFVNGGQRIRRALVRNQPPLERAGARNYFSSLLAKARGVVGIGSPRASLEANFALRELVGVENFHLGLSDGEKLGLDTILEITSTGAARLASLRDMEAADAVLVLGEDLTHTAPRLALALRQAVRNRAFSLAAELRIPAWQDAAVRSAAQNQRSPLFIAAYGATALDDVALSCFHGSPKELIQLTHAIARHLNPPADGAMSPLPSSAPPELDALAASVAKALQQAQRPAIVSGLGSGSETLLRAAAQLIHALSAARQSAVIDTHFALPECNSLGHGLMGGRPLSDAFSALESGEADTVLILENDLYRRADKHQVERFFEQARQLIVLDHSLTGTGRKAQLCLPCGSFAETEGTLVNSEGRAQRHFAVFPASGDLQASWQWLRDAAGKTWKDIDELTRACALALPALGAIPQAAPGSDFRRNGQKIPRQPQRYSGRTAMVANIAIHEPKQIVDADSALSYSMEGAPGSPSPALNPFVWAPGWNSNQSVGKFQAEIGGELKGGDPGVRLIEPGTKSPDRRRAPETTPAQPGEFCIVPLSHIFGSEETSMLSPPIAERAPAPYLALHPEDARQLSLEAGDVAEFDLWGETIRLPVILRPDLARGLAGLPAGLPDLPWVGQAGWPCRPKPAESIAESAP